MLRLVSGILLSVVLLVVGWFCYHLYGNEMLPRLVARQNEYPCMSPYEMGVAGYAALALGRNIQDEPLSHWSRLFLPTAGTSALPFISQIRSACASDDVALRQRRGAFPIFKNKERLASIRMFNSDSKTNVDLALEQYRKEGINLR